MWTTIQIIFVVLGLLLAFGGDRLSMPVLFYVAMACFGLASIAFGLEAIVTRHIVLGRRRRGSRSTYTGVAAILQGIQFNVIGLFLLGIAWMMFWNNNREIVQQFARRPGLPLLVFGAVCLMQAVIAITGSHEMQQGSRWFVILSLFIARLYPGLLLIVIGLGALGLGLFEIAAPTAFDERGGRMLEELYGLNR